MVEKKKTEVWEVVRLSKAIEEFSSDTAAVREVVERNNAAILLGLKVRYIVTLEGEKWLVSRLGKVVGQFESQAKAEDDARGRNSAAKLLGLKSRFLAVKQEA